VIARDTTSFFKMPPSGTRVGPRDCPRFTSAAGASSWMC